MATSQVQPHAPSTAELAAFRRTFPPHYGSALLHRDSPFMAPDVCATLYGTAPHTYGAWPHEREHGIGHHEYRDRHASSVMWTADIARREANRMRRESFADAEFELGAAAYPVYPFETVAWIDAQRVFVPR